MFYLNPIALVALALISFYAQAGFGIPSDQPDNECSVLVHNLTQTTDGDGPKLSFPGQDGYVYEVEVVISDPNRPDQTLDRPELRFSKQTINGRRTVLGVWRPKENEKLPNLRGGKLQMIQRITGVFDFFILSPPHGTQQAPTVRWFEVRTPHLLNWQGSISLLFWSQFKTTEGADEIRDILILDLSTIYYGKDRGPELDGQRNYGLVAWGNTLVYELHLTNALRYPTESNTRQVQRVAFADQVADSPLSSPVSLLTLQHTHFFPGETSFKTDDLGFNNSPQDALIGLYADNSGQTFLQVFYIMPQSDGSFLRAISPKPLGRNQQDSPGDDGSRTFADPASIRLIQDSVFLQILPLLELRQKEHLSTQIPGRSVSPEHGARPLNQNQNAKPKGLQVSSVLVVYLHHPITHNTRMVVLRMDDGFPLLGQIDLTPYIGSIPGSSALRPKLTFQSGFRLSGQDSEITSMFSPNATIIVDTKPVRLDDLADLTGSPGHSRPPAPRTLIADYLIPASAVSLNGVDGPVIINLGTGEIRKSEQN